MSRPRMIALLLVLGTLAVYLPAVHHDFTLYDDNDYVTENSIVQQGLTWSGIRWAFTTWHASNWHPLTWLSHMIDCQLFGFNAGMHHCVNVLFHAANVILLFGLLLRLTDTLWPSAFIAALFAWHPAHVESVAWISERKDVLSTFFALGALLFYAKYAKENRRPAFWISLFFFALALMSKPMFVTLPFVLLLLDYWPLQRFKSVTLQRLTLEKIPFFVLTAASCIITFLAQYHGGSVISLKKIPLAFRLCEIPPGYMRYLLKMFWPEHLAVFYPLPKAISLFAFIAAVFAIILISIIVWLGRKHRPYWLVGWLWFLGVLVPVIGLVQVGNAAIADRYTYFSCIGIFLAVTFGARDAMQWISFPKTIFATIAGVILAVCLFLTHKQLGYWRDDITLFSHAIAVTKDNDTAHLNLGVAFEKTGQKFKAIAEYRKALQLEPNRAETHNNLANLLADTGHPDQAIVEYQEALRINPEYVAAYNNWGTVLVDEGHFDEGIKLFSEAAQCDPDDWHSPYLIGKTFLKEGRDAEAISYLRKTIQIAPNNIRALTFLAQVLASNKNPEGRDGPTAMALAQKANALAGGIQPAILDVLAMSYAESGRFDVAQQTVQNAMDLAKAYDPTNDIAAFQQRLELYKNHQAWRESFLATNMPEQNFQQK